MTDEEIAEFCLPGLRVEVHTKFISMLTPEKREVIEKMRQIEMWDASGGVIPLPDGVLLDRTTDRHMRRYATGNDKP